MLKFNSKTKASPQRRAAEDLLLNLKPTMETETGRGAITINHFLTCRRSQNAEDFYPYDQEGTGFYTIDSIIATGGMGAIIRAFDNNLQRTVALKVMLNSIDATDASIYSFVAEAQITGQLEHPNIVPLHDIGVTADGTIYYTMKLISGRTMRDIIWGIRKGDKEMIEKFSIDKLLTIFQKVCDGMAYAHSLDVVHRDIKPDNIMIGEFGEVLILDWGLAKVLSPEGDAHEAATEGEEFDEALPYGGGDGFKTMVGQVKGTPNYMAPEQAEGRVADIDNRTDIYALGGILYSLLTLHPPISGSSVDQILTRVTNSDIQPPVDYNRGETTNPTGMPAPHCPDGKIPQALSAVAMACMAYDNEDRYTFVAALQGDITLFQTGFATAAQNAGFFTQLKLLASRNKKELFFIFLIIAGIIFTAASFITKVRLEIAKTKKEKAVAEKAVERARRTAPNLYKVAISQVHSGDFTNALVSIQTGIDLDTNYPHFYKLQGDIYQTFQDINKSHKAYALAKKKHDQAMTNEDEELKLTQLDAKTLKELKAAITVTGALKAAGNTSNLKAPGLRSLRDHMVKFGRSKEAYYIGTSLVAIDETLEGEYKKQVFLRAGLTEGAGPDANGELKREPDGKVTLWLKDGLKPITSITMVKGIQLRTLDLSRCSGVSDLSPLVNMPLETLNVSRTDVSDLTVIRSLTSLQELNLAGCKMLRDLSHLQGIVHIKKLDVSRTSISSLTPLGAIPLTHLDISFNVNIDDISPLNTSKLESLKMDNCSKRITKLAVLQNAPLDFLSMSNLVAVKKLSALASENTRLRDGLILSRTGVADLSPLKGKRIKRLDLFRCGNVTELSALKGMPLEHLDLRDAVRFSDISPLEGMPFKTLLLGGTKVSDISALQYQQFTELDLSGNKISDISVLRGAPLEKLNLARTQVTDIKVLEGMPLVSLQLDLLPLPGPDLLPLWECKKLEYLSITPPGNNVETIRQLKLKSLSYSSAPTPKAVFWERYDRTGRKQQ